MTFRLDPRLDRDSIFIADGPLSQLRLMDDARFPWLILVPRVADAAELIDLDGSQQRLLLAEINLASQLLRDFENCDKINIGMLGNIVRQLHVHVLARVEGDAAWPGPVWGHATAIPFSPAERASRIADLRERLTTPQVFGSVTPVWP